MMKMPLSSYSGPFLPLREEEQRVRDGLKTHIGVLARDIGERHIWQNRNLDEAGGYIDSAFAAHGHLVAKLEYRVSNVVVRNLEVEIPGVTRPDQVVVVGAHYDTVAGSPGANGNASGVAALIELARHLGPARPARTLRLVAFVNGEPPFFGTDMMGSVVYAERARERGENIVAMLALESIGYYSDLRHSQRYPFPLKLFHPNRGNFITFSANCSSRDLLLRAIASFRRSTQFPSQGIAIPSWVKGVGGADQWAFWKEGYPAVLVTDTAAFRYGHHHTPQDTPDKIDYERTARVVGGVARVVSEVAGIPDCS